MNNEFVCVIIGIFVVVIVVMMWNNKHEGVYIPPLAPNQVYQGDYTNQMTGNPRVWSCPPGEAGVGCPPIDEGYHSDEWYSHSGMEPASDHAPIDIIAPPFTEEVYALSLGMGPGILGSGRHTSEMF